MSRYRALLQEKADLEQEKVRLKADGAAIYGKLDAENRTDKTTEEDARLGQIRSRIAAIDADLSTSGRIGSGLVDEEERRAWERTAPAVQAPRITQLHDRAADRPWGHDTYGCSAEEFVAHHAYSRYDAKHPNHPRNAYEMAGFGEFMRAVQNAGTPGGHVDPRLLAGASGPTGASTGVPSDAGYLVRKDYSLMLLDRAVEQSQLAPLCDTIPIGDNADGIEAPYVDESSRATGSRWGGVQVYRRGEADTVTSKKVKIGEWKLNLEDLMGLSYSTGRVIRDAATHGRITADAFASEFSFKIDDEIVRGTGSGECLGVLNAPCLVTVSKETGQQAATVVTENLSKMWARLRPRWRNQARWFINADVEPVLDKLTKNIGTGGVEPNFVVYGPDGVLKIKGRPVQAIEHCESVGTVGDVILAAFPQYALITKGGIQADESMHVLFVYNEMTYRWVWRINGSPKDKCALTPYKGTSNTQSAFVVLATRS